MAATVTHKFVFAEKKCVIAHEGGEKPSHRNSTYINLLQYALGPEEPLIKKYVNQSDIKITKKK